MLGRLGRECVRSKGEEMRGEDGAAPMGDADKFDVLEHRADINQNNRLSQMGENAETARRRGR